MKFGIFGYYSKDSIGDQFILDNIITQLEHEFDEPVSFTVFTHDTDITDDLVNSDKIDVVPALPAQNRRPSEADSNSTTTGRTIPYSSTLKTKAKSTLDAHPNLWFLHDPVTLSEYSHWKSVYEELQSLDLLVLGGGNIVMDLYPYGTVFHFLYSKLAQLADTPTIYYAVGAGPLRSARAKFYYNRAIETAEAVTTRDQESLSLIERELDTSTTRTVLSADPAVWMSTDNLDPTDGTSTDDDSETQTETQIGVSVVPFYMEGYWPTPNSKRYSDYIETMSVVIDYLGERTAGQITFFATHYPTDLQPARDILSNTAYDNASICDERLNSDEIMDRMRQFDLVLCTRLHSLIPAFVSNTPLVAYAYQPKVRQFCRRIGLEEQCVDLDGSPKAIVNHSKSNIQEALEWEDEIPSHEQTLAELRADAHKSVSLVNEIISERDTQ